MNGKFSGKYSNRSIFWQQIQCNLPHFSTNLLITANSTQFASLFFCQIQPKHPKILEFALIWNVQVCRTVVYTVQCIVMRSKLDCLHAHHKPNWYIVIATTINELWFFLVKTYIHGFVVTAAIIVLVVRKKCERAPTKTLFGKFGNDDTCVGIGLFVIGMNIFSSSGKTLSWYFVYKRFN